MNYLYTKSTGHILLSSAGALPFSENDKIGHVLSDVEILPADLHRWKVVDGEVTELTDAQVSAHQQATQQSTARAERQRIVDSRVFWAIADKDSPDMGELQRAIQILGRQLLSREG